MADTPLERLAPIVEDIIAPQADSIDRDAKFPREAVEAMGRAGLLGLVSSVEVGGMGGGLGEMAEVGTELGRHCGSTAMVVQMHYAAALLVEAYGSRQLRERIAAGEALCTLAFSERGSRSHFWAPVSSATDAGEGAVTLDAQKSWVTSAGEADVYVWSSRPMAAEGLSTLWAVPADAPGLSSPPPFDGLGLRGNASSPIAAEGVQVPRSAMLGEDGSGFDLMMQIVLPAFQVASAACCVGMMDAAVKAAAAHAAHAVFEHLDGSTLADLPTIRAHLGRARIEADMASALLHETLGAIEGGRDDAMLKILEVKGAAGEAAISVTDAAMRVCGGAAFRKEVGVERRFRDARASAIMAPTTDVLYDFIGKAVTGLPLF